MAKNTEAWGRDKAKERYRAAGGKVEEQHGELDTEGRSIRDKFHHGKYYGTTSGDAVRQVHHLKSQGDYDPYTPMSGPAKDEKPEEESEPDARYKRGGRSK